MSKNQPQPSFNLNLAVNKFFLSAFVVIAFIAYAIHQRLTNSSPTADTSSSSTTAGLTGSQQQTSASGLNTVSQSGSSTAYKNGTYTGPQIDAYYGMVQVEAIVQNGKIADVQFLEYPQDRRTSQRINSYAVPYLQQEAVQAQSANVDMISGATLTSQAFIMSLQSALSSAKN